MVIGLILGIAASAWMATSAREDTLAAALPNPWLTASIGLAVVAVGWVAANAAPRFAAAMAGTAAPGAAYAAIVLAADGDRQLAYGWSAIPIALGCLALGAGLHAARVQPRPWSARRGKAPSLPRARPR